MIGKAVSISQGLRILAVDGNVVVELLQRVKGALIGVVAMMLLESVRDRVIGGPITYFKQENEAAMSSKLPFRSI
ncbi:hypothetical protein Y032_0006g3017 [Ancylostoma ceylanicum]|uniref:Uncharacterized protein n=1 Tax=Ancylostoma ceylanicum TaxID=53326 RepID=A0A016VRY4_9BILA|nr:hypothetical protein Y032_0006g3017 [Ancylostoma ceylanicum]